MQRWMMGLAAIAMCCAGLSGCGGSYVRVNAQDAVMATVVNPVTQGNAVVSAPAVDCDAFMRGLGQSCYNVMVYKEDGVTPLRLIDEAGNDLGEFDKIWATNYCDCFAQTAFQTFGCSVVMAHEELDDASYAAAYEPIVASCTEALADASEETAE